MSPCWNKDPNERPAFHVLQHKIQNILKVAAYDEDGYLSAQNTTNLTEPKVDYDNN